MNLSDVKTRVYRTFGDEAAVQITDDDIIRWVNDGQRMVCMQNETLLQKTSYTSSVSEQQNYDLPTDILVLRELRYKQPGESTFYKLDALSLQEMDEYVDGWDGTNFGTGRPTVYTIYENDILLFPIPDQDGTNNIKVVYSRYPTDLDDDADEIDLPVRYHSTIVDYCLQEAYKLDEDWAAVQMMNNKITSDVNANREQENWNNREFYPRISVRAEDEWI